MAARLRRLDECHRYAQIASLFESIKNLLKRGAVCLVVGILIAWFALEFLGVLHGHNDLSQLESDEEFGRTRSREQVGSLGLGTRPLGPPCLELLPLLFKERFLTWAQRIRGIEVVCVLGVPFEHHQVLVVENQVGTFIVFREHRECRVELLG